jgi:hypothetical protein
MKLGKPCSYKDVAPTALGPIITTSHPSRETPPIPNSISSFHKVNLAETESGLRTYGRFDKVFWNSEKSGAFVLWRACLQGVYDVLLLQKIASPKNYFQKSLDRRRNGRKKRK